MRRAHRQLRCAPPGHRVLPQRSAFRGSPFRPTVRCVKMTGRVQRRPSSAAERLLRITGDQPAVSPVRILALLTLLNFFNYLDRLAVYSLYPLIGRDFNLSDKQLGMLGTACLLVLALLALPAGWAGDRFGARLSITVSAVI